MIKILLYLWENYGLDSLQLGIICFFGWKLFTNHLKHIDTKVDKVIEKLDTFDLELGKTKERVSKLEGRIE